MCKPKLNVIVLAAVGWLIPVSVDAAYFEFQEFSTHYVRTQVKLDVLRFCTGNEIIPCSYLDEVEAGTPSALAIPYIERSYIDGNGIERRGGVETAQKTTVTPLRVSVSGQLRAVVSEERSLSVAEAFSIMSVSIEPEFGESDGDPVSVFVRHSEVLIGSGFNGGDFNNSKQVWYVDRQGSRKSLGLYSSNTNTTFEIQTFIGSIIDFDIRHTSFAGVNRTWGFQFLAGGSFLVEASFCAVPGDHNGDCVVALKDLAIVQAGLDSGFTRADVTEVVRNYGFDLSASPDANAAPVPEPSAMLLLLIGITAGIFRGRRGRRRDGSSSMS